MATITVTDDAEFEAEITCPDRHLDAWDEYEEGETLSVDDAVAGWRLTRLFTRGSRSWFENQSVVVGGLLSKPAECLPTDAIRQGLVVPTTVRAIIDQWWADNPGQPHRVPEPDCTCGYCVVRDLDDLVDEVLNNDGITSRMQLQQSGRQKAQWSPNPGVVMVSLQSTPIVTFSYGYDRVAEGWSYDPPDTTRAGRVLSTALILPLGRETEAEHLQSTGLPVLGCADLCALTTG